MFIKIDLRTGYHHIRIHLDDEWKTTFETRDGFIQMVSHAVFLYQRRRS